MCHQNESWNLWYEGLKMLFAFVCEFRGFCGHPDFDFVHDSLRSSRLVDAPQSADVWNFISYGRQEILKPYRIEGLAGKFISAAPIRCLGC